MAHATGVPQPPLSQNGTTASAGHPLDPLTGAELGQAVRILGEGGRLGEGVRIASISLIEPEKHAVEALRPGDQLERKALGVLVDRAGQAAYEVVVDLLRHSVVSATRLPSGIQPSIMLDEFAECEQAVRRSPVFQAALAKRGVTEINLVMVEPWSAGMYGNELPEDSGLRRMRSLAALRAGTPVELPVSVPAVLVPGVEEPGVVDDTQRHLSHLVVEGKSAARRLQPH